MPFSTRGRPGNEIVDDTTPIIPFDRFGRIGTADDTATIQAAIDASSEFGIKVGQEGEFNVNKIVIKNRARIVAPGESSMRLIARTGSAEYSLIQLQPGVVQNVFLKGISVVGQVSGQAGMWLKAIPAFNPESGIVHGGLWYFRFEDMEFTGFTGADTVWLDGYGNAPGDPNAFMGPIQFGTVSNVRSFRGALDRAALRLSGQVGQINFDAGCQFDSSLAGYADGGTTENIRIERDVKGGVYANSDMAPYSINFIGTTCQGGKRGVTIERANSINMIAMHFENLKEGIMNSISAWGNTVESCVFGLVGINGGAGWGVRNQGGLISCRDLTWNGNSSGMTDMHYWSDYDQPIVLDGFHVDTGQEIKTRGITRAAITVAATIDTGYANHVYVNGPAGAITITNIVSQLIPGDLLTIHANAGGLTLGDGTGAGAINLGSAYRAPARIPQDGMAILRRDDLAGGPWKIVTIGGNRGHQRPLGTTVNASMSPYSIPADLGTIRVDTTAGNVILKLPSVSKVPPGYRVTVVKVSSPDTNICYINGNVTSENPGGFSDNTVRVSDVYQSIDFERNGLIGAGGWDPLAGSNMKNATPGAVATLTFGSHFSTTPPGGTFNGSVGVTVATDASYAPGIGNLVARSAYGQGAFGTVGSQTNAQLSARGYGSTPGSGYSYGNSFEWGHENSSGYGNTLGTEPSSGYGFIGFFLEHSNTATGHYITRGNVGILQIVDGTGGIGWWRTASGALGDHTGPTLGGASNMIRLMSIDVNATLRVPGGVLAQIDGASIFGAPSGSVGVKANQNFFFYDNGGANWAGMQSDSSGGVSINVGLSTRYTALFDNAGYFSAPYFIMSEGYVYSRTTGGALRPVLTSLNTSYTIIYTPQGTGAIYVSTDSGGIIYFDHATHQFRDLAGTTVMFSMNTSSGIFSIPLEVYSHISNTGTIRAKCDYHSYITLSPGAAASGYVGVFANEVIGSLTCFQCSGSASIDRMWLVAFPAGNTQFYYPMGILGVLTISTASGVTGVDIADTVSNSGISVTPASSSYTAFFDNRRIGSRTQFRSSSNGGSVGDTTWLDVFPGGTAVFSKVLTAAGGLVSNSNVAVNPGTAALFISDNSQNVQFVLRPASSSYSAFIDNTRPGSATIFRNSFSSVSDTTWLTVNAAGTASFGGSISTGTPSGGTSGFWKFGIFVVGTPSPNGYVQLDINGTLYQLAATI